MIFENRSEAGKKLAQALEKYREEEVVIAGLARGGVVVAAEVAHHFGWPLDLVIVKKIGAPENEELALGAIAEEGEGVFNEDLISLLGVSKRYIQKEVERKREEIKQWKESFLKDHPFSSFKNKVVILVDDGIATGASMKVAVHLARGKGAQKIVMAVPVSSQEAYGALSKIVSEAVCLLTPSPFPAVGAFYRHFEQVTNEEVVHLIRKK